MNKELTVAGLHAALSMLISDGHARKPVCIDKTTFGHVLECDGAVICPIENVRMRFAPMIGDDGELALRKDGTEKGKTCVVLEGGWAS